jgi:hypothetical protein
MKKFLLLSFVFVLAVTQLLHAQGRVITGRVISGEDNSALPGVNVIERGTNNGTTTAADGTYRITTTSTDPVIVFRFIGFTQEELTVGARTEVNVTMTPDIRALSEIVVVGYGTQDRRDVTGAISKITSESLEDIPIATLDQGMQGRIAGVQISQNSGTPGGGISVRVRGSSSISASNQVDVSLNPFP